MQLRRSIRRLPRAVPGQGDPGMALLLAVLIGVVLIAAASALLAIQLLSRRSGASASNRDLAEAAAMSGLSRIVATLNGSSGDYRYLWEVPSSAWADAASSAGGATIRPLLSQPCSFKPIDAATLAVLQASAVGGERQDGGVPITSRYNLRSYSKTGLDWVLAVEGLSERGQGSGALHARSLIARRFEVGLLGVPRTGNWEDWAVLAGKELELGSSTVTGPGLVQLVLDDTDDNHNSFASSSSCDSGPLQSRISASNNNLASRIWPTLGQTMPGAGWFESNTVIDKIAVTGSERVWQIDDSQTFPTNYSDAVVSGTNIILPQSKICQDNSTNRPCQVRIQKIRLRSRSLLIEAQDRPVILRLTYSGSTIDLADQGKICAVRVGSTSCYSGEPQRLVILGTTPDAATSCSDSTSSDQSFVSITGNTLPEALVVLPEATFRLSGAATLRGLVWAKRICASAGLTLLSQGGSDAVIKQANSTWSFPTNATAGKSLIRGRGTSTDPFQPWQ